MGNEQTERTSTSTVSPIRYLVGVLILTVTYVLSALVGLYLETEYGGVTPIWPPSGIAVAVLILRGRRYWPMIVIGEFCIALYLQQPISAGLIGGFAQLAEGLLACLLINRRGFKGITSSGKAMLWFSAVGVVVPPLLSAAIGSTMLRVVGLLSPGDYLSGFVTWWLGDAVGILVLTPLLVGLTARSFRDRGACLRCLGYMGMLALMCAALIIYGDERSYYLLFVLIPFVVVAAIHFRLLGAAAATLLLTIIVFGMRPEDLADGDFITMIRMAFVGTCAFTGYLVTGLLESRQRGKAALSVSERTHREIFNSTREAICVLDRDTGAILRSNRAAAEMIGADEGAASQSFFSLMAGDEKPYTEPDGMRLLRRCVEEGPQVVEWRSGSPDGSAVWSEITLKTAFIEGEERVLAVVRSVADRKEYEQVRGQLFQAQKAEAIGTLAGGIAHDFNNILAGIMGYTELALKHKLPADHPAAEYLVQVLQAGKRATDLVRQILTFSRPSEVEATPMDGASVVKEVVRFVRASLPPTIIISTEVTASSTTVVATPTNIHQILMNLVTNASHSIPEGRGEITVGLSNRVLGARRPEGMEELPPGEYLEISVADTGCGMDRETIDKMFEPYFTTKAQEKGTGLGMSVVRGIVEQLGGAVAVESEVGRGTTVRVLLPVLAVVEVEDDYADHKLPTGDESILLVDDNPLLTDVAGRFLEKQGYQVTVFEASRVALEHFSSSPDGFQLIITDMWMPEMTGVDLCRAIRAIRSEIPILMCSGNPDIVNAADLDKLEVREIVRKPLNLRSFATSVREALDSSG